MKILNLFKLTLSFVFLLTVSCKDKEEKMAKGFVLPEGNVKRGQEAFVQMNCHQCHTVAGVTLPKIEGTPVIQLQLGGEVHRVKTYGELVTAVINPRHVVSKEYLETFKRDERYGVTTPMPSMNEQMTVHQMIDIVEFLNAHYVKLEREYRPPHTYYGP